MFEKLMVLNSSYSNSMRSILCSLCGLMLAALVFVSVKTEAASFNYLYIEASEGNSSGGHVAIQFDQEVYHFQYLDPGVIRLFKRDADEFHFLYRYLQNRPIHEGRVDVTEETFQLLKDHFKWQFLLQEGQFGLIEALQKDKIFIRRLLFQLTTDNTWFDAVADSTLRLNGVGLFYPDQPYQQLASAGSMEQPSETIEMLRQKVEQRYGADFLRHRQEKIESQLQALTPDVDQFSLNSGLSDENIPAPVYSFADKYSDYLTALFAIKVITDAKPLRFDAFFQIHQQAFLISPEERPILLNLKHNLEASLIKSINSTRPDWGYAALVNMARFLAIETSLKSGYWVFVDDFSQNGEEVGMDEYSEYRDQIRLQIDDARDTLNYFRQSALKNRNINEMEYSRFEMAANRYFELLKTEQDKLIRYNGEKALPTKSIGFPKNYISNITQQELIMALSVWDDLENNLVNTLKQNYSYDLINRNCVTELFRTINQALLKPFSTKEQITDLNELVKNESKVRLGGYVDPLYNFVPFVSYQSVLDRYNVTLSRDLNSYRGIELAKLKTRQSQLETALTESNIMSSSLYSYNPDDALFLFFTDDQLIFRPVFGVFNTLAGVSQSIYGFFSWPFDSGKNLKAGATGILMSVPELFFFNMRKGSYKFLSFNQIEKANKSLE